MWGINSHGVEIGASSYRLTSVRTLAVGAPTSAGEVSGDAHTTSVRNLRKLLAASTVSNRRLVHLSLLDSGLLARRREPLERLEPRREITDLMLDVQYGHGSV